jgi:hypothetical protein
MAEVVQFKQRREPEGPYATGEAACQCGHEWVGVAPIGVMALECPSCGSMNGKWKHPFGPAVGDSVFRCQCEADTFFFKQSAIDGRTLIVCTGCGDFKGIDDVFPFS